MNPRIPHLKVLMFRAESEVSILVLCMPCSPHFTAVQIKSAKGMSIITVAAMRKYDGAARFSYRLRLKYPFPFSVRYFRLIKRQYESRTV